MVVLNNLVDFIRRWHEQYGFAESTIVRIGFVGNLPICHLVRLRLNREIFAIRCAESERLSHMVALHGDEIERISIYHLRSGNSSQFVLYIDFDLLQALRFGQRSHQSHVGRGGRVGEERHVLRAITPGCIIS